MDSHLLSERHPFSLSSTTDFHPQLALYRVQASRLSSQEAMKRNKSAGDAHSVPTAYLDPGIDPASVDFRNFFAYVPNEVKHRKRTTRDQVKVLENVFDRNTKPDSTLRQRLATELQMSARGVQVWFQNRRAKEKSNGKKALAASASSSTVSNFNTSSSPNEEGSKGTEEQDDEASPPPSSITSSPEMSPARKAHVPIPPENSQRVPPEIQTNYTVRHTGPPLASPDLYNSRRGSLPTIIQAQPSMSRSSLDRSPAVNILARRGSAERLGINPYARFLMGRPRASPYQPRPTSLRESHGLHEDAMFDSAPAFDQFELRPALLGPDRPRPMLNHRASMPHVFSGAHVPRRASMPMDPAVVYPPSAASISTSTTTTFTAPDNHMYAISSRSIPSPIPGPLPRSDFSFPAPPIADTEGGDPNPIDYTEFQSYSFGRSRADDNDTEDDATEASYDAFSSRFGSITSVAGSESSNTSAYYSDVGSCNELPSPWYPGTRRGSDSGQFLDMVSGLDLGHGGHESDDCDCPTSEFPSPSPSSTVSPGNSHGSSPPGKFSNTSTQSLPISGSSELAHALQTNRDQNWDGAHSGLTESSTITHLNARSSMGPNDIYSQSSAAPPIYPHHQSDSNSSSTSSLNLPAMSEQPTKLRQDGDPGQLDHYLHNPHDQHSHSHAQASTTESHYSTTGSYPPYYGQEYLELHHAMEYQNSGYMSDVTSAVENTLQTYETYL